MATNRRNTTHRTQRSTANDLKLALGRAKAATAATVAPPARVAPAARQGAQEAEVEPVVLTPKTSKMVEDIKEPFTAFTEGHTLLERGRAQLAPRFMKTFNAWASETGGTFVAFTRVLDPTIPEDREGYRAHTSYLAADYLRRLMGVPAQSKSTAEGDKPATPITVIATLLATMAPVVEDMTAIWTAFENSLHWSPQRIRHLQQLVDEEAEPLLTKAANERKLHAA